MTGIMSEGSIGGSAPNCGARQRSRSRLPDAWGQPRWSSEFRLWSGRECHRPPACSGRPWRNWYHGDPDILGKSVRIGDHHPFTIVGVEPEGFSGLIIDGSTDVTIPMLSTPQAGPTDVHDPRILWLRLDGRLKPGIDLTQAQTNMSLLWPRILDATPPPGYSGEKRARFFARKIKKGIGSPRRFLSPPAILILAESAAVPCCGRAADRVFESGKFDPRSCSGAES